MTEGSERWEKINTTFAGLPIEANGSKRRILDKDGSILVEYEMEEKP